VATRKPKAAVPDTVDGKLGYIVATVENIENGVEELKEKTVPREECHLRHGQTVTKDECRDKRAAVLEGIKHQDFEVTAENLIPRFDFWDWAKKRIPVILGIMAILGGLGVVYKFWLETKQSNKELKNFIMVQNGKTKIETIPVPVHYYHTIKPDASPPRTRIRPRRRPRRRITPP
jgi:hypothetical protein